jgi:hypothetical protein
MIRETEDYECDTAEKIVKDENIYKFYIHGGENNLIFSRMPQLSQDDKQEIARGVPSSYSQGDPESRPFLIPLSDEEAEEGIPLVLYNLLGRLISSNYDTKYYDDPLGEKPYLHSIEAFEPEFERKRLQVTEKFDETGLLYLYDHGLNLAEDILCLMLSKLLIFTFWT